MMLTSAQCSFFSITLPDIARFQCHYPQVFGLVCHQQYIIHPKKLSEIHLLVHHQTMRLSSAQSAIGTVIVQANNPPSDLYIIDSTHGALSVRISYHQLCILSAKCSMFSSIPVPVLPVSIGYHLPCIISAKCAMYFSIPVPVLSVYQSIST